MDNVRMTPADVERMFDAELDETYSFGSVGGPFTGLRPSEVLRECDPIGYRNYLLEFVDALMKEGRLVEVDGIVYHKEE